MSTGKTWSTTAFSNVAILYDTPIVSRPAYPSPNNASSRVTIHITITKSLTPVPIITTALIPIFMTTPTPRVTELIPHFATTSIAIEPANNPAEAEPQSESTHSEAASYMV